MSKLQEGWVELELERPDGTTESLTLKPTPAALLAISRRFGDMNQAMQAMLNRDFDAIVAVVIQGAGLSADKRAPARLERDIFATGLNDVAAECLKYLAILQNGGKPLREDEEEQQAMGDEEGNY